MSSREPRSPSACSSGAPSHSLQDHDAVALLHALVSIPSVSGSEALAVQEFVRVAQQWGMHASIDAAGNGIVTRTQPPHQHNNFTDIVLLGHIDTVPGVLPVRIDGDWLHGRGSVDAKGPLAAMLVAAARATLPSGVRIHVIAAVGEETPHSPGASHLAQTLRPDACIIAEPSGWDGVTLGYKGALRLHARARRECGHSAGPHASSADAIHAFWQTARETLATQPTRSPRIFDQVQCTIRSLRSMTDGLHEHTELEGSLRLPPHLTPLATQELLGQVAAAHDVVVRCEGHTPAHVSDRNDAVVRAISNAIRAHAGTPHPKLKTGTSDMNIVAPHWECPIAAYGPGDSDLDHTPHERLSIAEYLRAIGVLTTAIATLAQEIREGDRTEPSHARTQTTRP
jgi:[amino group carrier protein]-lysine/ornithine hydrolase